MDLVLSAPEHSAFATVSRLWSILETDRYNSLGLLIIWTEHDYIW
jgi:hypothetical protein